MLDEEGSRYCKVVENSAVHLGKLIDDLLAFSRMGRTELTTVKIEMNKLVNNVFSELTTPKEREKIHLTLHKLPAAMGDPVTIRQVLFNLISNAIKYSSKTEKQEIEVGYKKGEAEHIYYVSDNGEGFDMKYVSKLFGVFQRLHKARDFEGIGIGLANVNRIITRHGGICRAESEPDKGATFFFSLPKLTII